MKSQAELTHEERVAIRKRLDAGEAIVSVARSTGVKSSVVASIKHGSRSGLPQQRHHNKFIVKPKDVLRVLPTNNTDLPMQVCERLNARLTVSACGERSKRADSGLQESTYWVCRDCPTGQANARAKGA